MVKVAVLCTFTANFCIIDRRPFILYFFLFFQLVCMAKALKGIIILLHRIALKNMSS